MLPLVVLGVTFLVTRLAGFVGLRPFKDWVLCLRCALAAMFLLTAFAHWGTRRADLVRMVPPSFSDPELWVSLTGIAEIAGALGLLLPWTAPWAASGLALLLCAMFPANAYAARAGLTIGGEAVTPLVPRALVQVAFLVLVLAAGFMPCWRNSHSTARSDPS